MRVYGGMFITMPGLDEVAPQIKNYETDLFHVRYIKTWTDGSTQGGTGYFTEPYYKLDADTKMGARGTQEDFNRQVTQILQLGFAPGTRSATSFRIRARSRLLSAGVTNDRSCGIQPKHPGTL